MSYYSPHAAYRYQQLTIVIIYIIIFIDRRIVRLRAGRGFIVSSIIVPSTFANVEVVPNVPTKEMLKRLTPEQREKVEKNIRQQVKSLLKNLEHTFLNEGNLDDFLHPENTDSSLDLLDSSTSRH